MGADSFLVASDAEHEKYTVELGKRCGNFCRPGEKVTTRGCLTKHGYLRLCEYKDMYSGTGDFVVDLSQGALFARCGSVLPSVCTSSIFYSLSRGRFFMPADIEASQGWPAVWAHTTT